MYKSISYETSFIKFINSKIILVPYYMVDSRKSCNIECLCYLTHMHIVRKQNKMFRNKILFAFQNRALSV
jgi:hypothetical protein